MKELILPVKAAWTWWWIAVSTLALLPNASEGAKSYRPTYGDAMLENWRWRTFPQLSGLDVHCMAETADGSMWFGTANGLWSYDGLRWARHAEVGRIVTSLCIQSDGTLNAAGVRGVSRLSKGTWTHLLALPPERVSRISDIWVKNLCVGPAGSLWAATPWGVARHQTGDRWTLYVTPRSHAALRANPKAPNFNVELLPEAVATRLDCEPDERAVCDFTALCVDAQGRLWAGTAGAQVLFHDPAAAGTTGGSWRVFDAVDGVRAGPITSIASMQDGTVWVAHADSDVANIFDGKAWRRFPLPLHHPPLDVGDEGGQLLQTQDGAVWLSARFALYALREGQWHAYKQPETPFPSIRNVMLQSSDGALWFSGPNSEIYRVDYQTGRWLTLENLVFQWESPSGEQWFLERDGRVVQHHQGRWVSYGVEDGVIDTPVAIHGTRHGDIWVAGSHGRTAATARLQGGRWTRQVHDQFSFGIDWRAVFEASDGSMWFGSFVDSDGPAHHRNGLLQFKDESWIHHHQAALCPDPPGNEHASVHLPPSSNPDHPIEKFVCMGESSDGRLWAGRTILASYDGKAWQRIRPSDTWDLANIESVVSAREGHVWLGMRESGVWRYDGAQWRQFGSTDGLLANSVRSLVQTTDGSIWAVTDRGSYRFDGQTWMEDVLPEAVIFPHEGGSLEASPSGRLWVNRYSLLWMRRAWSKSPPPEPDADFRTVCREFRGTPPDTTITAGATEISQPGNLAVLWSAAMPWREPKYARLQFSYRLDQGPWSPFTTAQGHSFFTLPHGKHRLEVRARDADFNIDPTPATLDFVVLPPVWRQAWFIALILLLASLIVAQTVRVMMEQARLRAARDQLEIRVRERTSELEDANRELAAVNRELEAFSYSVSHDLRSPLRSIDGFSKSLLEDYAGRLDEEGVDDLHRVRAAAQRMGHLIDDMLKLSRVTRGELRWSSVNLSGLAHEICADLAQQEPGRKIELSIAEGVIAEGDTNLLRIALSNLLGNAWKFTSKRPVAHIAFGVTDVAGESVYFVRDDGAGFDMEYASKLFGAFTRLHDHKEYPGTGIGLATVQRVILRHGGRVWAEAVVDRGATFYFTLGRQAPT